MNELVEEVNRMSKEIEAKKKELVDVLKPKFQEMFLPFFTKYPFVVGFQWQQYTPYFNDGDECTFRVCDVYMKLKGYGLGSKKTDDDDDYSDYNHMLYCKYTLETKNGSYWKKEYENEKVKYFRLPKEEFNFEEYVKDRKALCEAFESIPKETMKELFGDHSEITVTKKGLQVEEYEHD